MATKMSLIGSIVVAICIASILAYIGLSGVATTTTTVTEVVYSTSISPVFRTVEVTKLKTYTVYATEVYRLTTVVARTVTSVTIETLNVTRIIVKEQSKVIPITVTRFSTSIIKKTSTIYKTATETKSVTTTLWSTATKFITATKYTTKTNTKTLTQTVTKTRTALVVVSKTKTITRYVTATTTKTVTHTVTVTKTTVATTAQQTTTPPPVQQQVALLIYTGGDEVVNDVAIHENGTIYIAGYTDTLGAGSRDALVLKIAPDNTLVWALTIGGALDEEAQAIAIDDRGNVVVAGYTDSCNISGGRDAFVAWIRSHGEVAWFTVIDLGGNETIKGIAIDSSGYIYLVGTIDINGGDAFVAKLRSDGTPLWVTLIGGSRAEEGEGIAIDSNGDIYVVGSTESFGAGLSDCMIAKLDSFGILKWFVTVGGQGEDACYSVAVDDSYVYAAGGADGVTVNQIDALVVKLTKDGEKVWHIVFGGSQYDSAEDIAIIDGYIYAVGSTTSFGWGEVDSFIAKIDGLGRLLSFKTIGSTAIEEGRGIGRCEPLGLCAVDQRVTLDTGIDMLILRLFLEVKTGSSDVVNIVDYSKNVQINAFSIISCSYTVQGTVPPRRLTGIAYPTVENHVRDFSRAMYVIR